MTRLDEYIDRDPCCETCGGGLGGPQFCTAREFECCPCAYERITGRSYTKDVDSGRFAQRLREAATR